MKTIIRARAGLAGILVAAVLGGGLIPPAQAAVDPIADAEKAATAAGEKFRTTAKDRAKEVCEKTGLAECLGKWDWNTVRAEMRAQAEDLVEKKLLSLEDASEITLTPDIAESLKDPSQFYVPYENTRAAIAGDPPEEYKRGGSRGISGEKLEDFITRQKWIWDFRDTFSRDSTNLEKAAALTALVPGIGNLMQLTADVGNREWADVGFDALYILLEAAGFLGLEAAGSAGWILIAIQPIASWIMKYIQFRSSVAELKDSLDSSTRESTLSIISTRGSEGWMAQGYSATLVEMVLSNMQTIELQRATVKGMSQVIATATTKGRINPNAMTRENWATNPEFSITDTEIDDLLRRAIVGIRDGAARILTDQLNEMWKDDGLSEKLMLPYIRKYLDLGWGNDPRKPSPGTRAESCPSGRASKGDVCEIWYFTPKPIKVEEVTEVLKDLGLPGSGLSQYSTGLKPLLTAQGASGQVDAAMRIPKSDDYWVFSGDQYARARISDGEKDTIKAEITYCPTPIKQTWGPVADLLELSKGRINAILQDNRLYDVDTFNSTRFIVTSGKWAINIAIDNSTLEDRQIGYMSSVSKLASRNAELFKFFDEQVGSFKIDAAMPVPGEDNQYFIFAGPWQTKVTVSYDSLSSTGPSYRTAEAWPRMVGETGQDEIQAVFPGTTGLAGDHNFVFANGSYAKVTKPATPGLPKPNATADAWFVAGTAKVYWSNGGNLPTGTMLVAKDSARGETRKYSATDGVSDDWSAPTNPPYPDNRTLQVYYEWIQPDGTVEKSPTATVMFECWLLKCNGIPQN